MKQGLLATLLALMMAVPALARQGFPPASFAQPTQTLRSVDLVVLPQIDTVALQAEDEKKRAEEPGGPARFAAAVPVHYDAVRDGTWETLPDGRRVWRLRIVSPGAFSLNFGFSRFRLPGGATVHLYPAGSIREPEAQPSSGRADPTAPAPKPNASAESRRPPAWDGPYDARDASPESEFWTAVVPGDDAVIELAVPAGAEFEPELVIGTVGHDYRGFGSLARSLLRVADKQGTCNNDVICPEGDPWRNEIRSVAVYTLSGVWTCSGTLVNSHDPDHPPYFLTANHCHVEATNDQSMVVYWNFESPNCGDLQGGLLSQHQTGAEWKANWATSDFCLVRLATTPSTEFDVYYAGWDARDETRPTSAVGIHHPNTDEKAISFCNTPLTITTYLQPTVPGDATHWRITNWDDGTTEPGSSGSGLWDPNHRLVGQLHGGSASCTSITSDWYGRLSQSWNGGNTDATRLRTWLDPAASNVLVIDGRNWDGTTTLPGDADLINGVNTADLVAIANHILETQLISGQGFLNADRNFDGRLSVVDLVAVVNIILQGPPLAANAAEGAEAAAPVSGAAAPAETGSARTPAGSLRLEAGFSVEAGAIVFRLPSLAGTEAGSAASREGRPAALSLVLAADPGAFAPGLQPVLFPDGGGWQGLAMVTADGTVRAVLFDPGAGASASPPSFALPVVGEQGEARWVTGDASDATAAPLTLTAGGFPVRIGPAVEHPLPAGTVLAVRPNPARGACVLRFTLPHSGTAAFTLHDPAGRRVFARDLGPLPAGSGTSELTAPDVAALAPGLYFARLTLDGERVATTRLLITR